MEEVLENIEVKRSARYKQIYWIGEKPIGWQVKRIKHLVNIFNGQEHKHVVADSGFPVMGSGGRFAYASEYLYDGEVILLGRKGTIDKPLYFNGRFWTVDTMFYAVPKQPNIGRFIYYLSTTIPFGFYRTSTAIPSMTQNDINNHFVVIPATIEEQTRIANFLDKKTVQIDQAIAQKEQLIELLKERRQIIIHKTVTQGLDPDVEMKDSGVEWIGEIPEHWTVLRSKFIFNEIDERSETGTEELLSVSHMTGVTPRSEKNVSMFMAEDYTGSKLCDAGDIVINIMWAWMGALGVSDRLGIVSPSYGVFRQKMKVMSSWYLEQLLCDTDYVAEYNRRSTGLHSSRLRLYADYFLDMALGFPPLEEQRKIEKYVTNQTDKIDRAIARTEQEIEKLKEYKTTLINSAVTGKIKI